MTQETTEEQDWGRVFCDLVMKGGITSGVVYPSAISRLAQVYRLRNIGGASAGAIAAAGGAAAEYRRQTTVDPARKMAGFERLDKLADELGARTAGHSRLFHLFQPSVKAAPIFSILVRMLNRRSRLARLLWGIAGLLGAFPLVAAVCMAAGLYAVYSAAIGGMQLSTSPGYAPAAYAAVVIFTLLSALVVPIVVCGIWACRRFVSAMVTQNFGLCTGMRSRDQPDEPAALTEWLHALFQDVAGKPPGSPLTFGDLRRVEFAETPQVDGIVLRMMTTCLTGGRPYTMPIEEDCFYFNPEELRDYFPEDVIAWLTDPARKRQNVAMREQNSAGENASLSPCEEDPQLHALPVGDELPVILGVRMSLCFPILLSAIPLYRNSLRRVKPKNSGEGPTWERYVERVLFTDGGVCSNLPIHLFDAPLPAWPTFAINLRDDFDNSWESVDDRAVRPRRGQGFAGDSHPIPQKDELASVITFLSAIVTTMQNWRDVLQRSAGGSRDRVVTVRHTGNEGGLNLDMEPDAITRMAESGKLAATKLIAGFCPAPRSPQLNDDWTYHRWVRLRIQLRVMDDQIRKLSRNVTSLHNQPTVPDLLNHPEPYVGDSYKMAAPDRAAAAQFLVELANVEAAMDALQHDFQKHSPKPGSDLRVTPRF